MTLPQRRPLLVVLAALGPLLAAPTPYADTYLGALDQALAVQARKVDKLVPLAEAVADKLLQGHQLLITGSMPQFDLEGIVRAGGLCLVQRVTDKLQPAAGDTVMYGVLGSGMPDDAAKIKALRDQGATVILFGAAGSPAAKAADQVIDHGVGGHEIAVEMSDGAWVGPLDGVLNVANLWTFSGELIAACTRKGKMPTMYQSVMVEGARERNDKVRTEPFHSDLKIEPIEPQLLGYHYLAGLSSHLAHLCQFQQQESIDRAAREIAEAKKNGGRLWVQIIGHYCPAILNTPGDPGIWLPMDVNIKPETLKDTLRRGDVLLHVGYTAMPAEQLAAANAAGAVTIAAVAGTPDGPPEHSDAADIWIDPGWLLGDAELTIPGYDCRILPPSGVIQSAVFWMLTAETYGRLHPAG